MSVFKFYTCIYLSNVDSVVLSYGKVFALQTWSQIPIDVLLRIFFLVSFNNFPGQKDGIELLEIDCGNI